MLLLLIYNYILLKRDNSDMLEEAHMSTWVKKTKEQSSVKRIKLHFNFYKSQISSNNTKFPLKLQRNLWNNDGKEKLKISNIQNNIKKFHF